MASTVVWPWFLIVGMIAITAPRLLDAVFRASPAMVLMVLGCYLIGIGDLTEGNRDALFGWGAVALTAVPVVVACAYGIKRAVSLMFRPPAPPRRR